MTDDFSSRYPGYDVFSKAHALDWDEQTWSAVQDRVSGNPTAMFFTEPERATLETVVNRIIPQPDRKPENRIPIVPWIDAKLFHDRRDGYRYEELPPQREAWRLAIEGFDETARALFGNAFRELDSGRQDDVLRAIEGGKPPGKTWSVLPAARFFKSVLCITITKAYYSHPEAWNEIGYSGPSSPRGHVRIWIGGVDPWEAHEHPTRWDTE